MFFKFIKLLICVATLCVTTVPRADRDDDNKPLGGNIMTQGLSKLTQLNPKDCEEIRNWLDIKYKEIISPLVKEILEDANGGKYTNYSFYNHCREFDERCKRFIKSETFTNYWSNAYQLSLFELKKYEVANYCNLIFADLNQDKEVIHEQETALAFERIQRPLLQKAIRYFTRIEVFRSVEDAQSRLAFLRECLLSFDEDRVDDIMYTWDCYRYFLESDLVLDANSNYYKKPITPVNWLDLNAREKANKLEEYRFKLNQIVSKCEKAGLFSIKTPGYQLIMLTNILQ